RIVALTVEDDAADVRPQLAEYLEAGVDSERDSTRPQTGVKVSLSFRLPGPRDQPTCEGAGEPSDSHTLSAVVHPHDDRVSESMLRSGPEAGPPRAVIAGILATS